MPRKYHTCRGCRRPACWCGFNEAGADAPEIRWRRLFQANRRRCFNEAGADAPEIPGTPSKKSIMV